jgi:hypothetical protein
LIVQAGNNIHLGATGGIQSTGKLRNPFLQSGESPLVVVAGITSMMDFSGLAGAFDDLRQAGVEYSQALADGAQELAAEIVDEARASVIPLLTPGENHGEGNINMVKSQIFTGGNAADAFVIATGDINVGQTALGGDSSKNTGIYTTSGGAINVYSKYDMNVNESRIATFLGNAESSSDITIWSDYGDVNAGRGSRTEVSASSARTVIEKDPDTNEIINISVQFDPPAVGSGIRALTFDPDGPQGPQAAPEPGDIFLFAPEGEIDAGEAGIKGKNIVLGAQEVVNAQNIEVAGTSVGVPDTSAASAGIGALAGAGSLSETSKMAEESAAIESAQDRFAQYVEELSDSLVPKWISVEVMGFEENDELDDKD